MISFKKIPVIETGQMIYWKDDPEKKPYRWKIWDDVEKRIDSNICFCNPREAKYRYVFTINWKIEF